MYVKQVTCEAGDGCRVWRYLVTMADNGCELKLWDCTTWSCLQTLRLTPCQTVPLHFQVTPCVKAQLDPTASYIVLSDIRRKVCHCSRHAPCDSYNNNIINIIQKFITCTEFFCFCFEFRVHVYVKGRAVNWLHFAIHV